MSETGERSLELEGGNLPFCKRNLADFLTLSRGIIGLVVLSLSFAGTGAYLTVVILTLSGAATDILDGKAARHYLGENREGRMGKHDVEMDTFFLLCVLGYMTFSGIVTERVLGLGWIGLVVISALLSRMSLRVLVVSEVITVIALLLVSLFYDSGVFWMLIVPAGAVGLFINRRRVLYLLFDYWPSLFSR